MTSAEAAARLARLGPNSLQTKTQSSDLGLLVRQFTSPIIVILAFATVLSGILGDVTDATIILAIITLSGALGFWQERRASRDVEGLLAIVHVEASVLRDGQRVEVPVESIVPGDVVLLRAGDVIPGDCRVLTARMLLVDEAALTGETFPVEKSAAPAAPKPAAPTPAAPTPTAPAAAPSAPEDRSHLLFLGTHVVSGTGGALVLRTGRDTEFGQVSQRLAQRPTPTAFERGLTAFGYLLVRAMVVLVAVIFVLNVVLGRPLIDSALFSLALAVGLTPQLLPAIVTISLSAGARLMAHQRVIVKRLDAIEDFGEMAILCTDKTGTMTTGTVTLDASLDLAGQPSDVVRRLAALNAKLQEGIDNPIDDAIVAATSIDFDGVRRLDELPYDFTRRRLSILADDGGKVVIVTKGAVESVLAACTQAQLADGAVVPLARVQADVAERFAALSAQGDRVLALATRDVPGMDHLTPADEAGLVLRGLLTFVDPPKPDAAATIGQLQAAGIDVRMITGDNALVAAHVGRMVGLDASVVLTGDDLATLDDATLATRAAATRIFAGIDPLAKERIIRALRASGEVVGYLGDGINDAPALHAADVGISVNSGVDVAKQAAAIVLLDKDLRVLLDGVIQGRRTFANTMKYVFTTTSANFGNMLSMAVASLILPYLPLLASQILVVNFLTDLPATTIATDEVDTEQLARPSPWNIGFVQRFMLAFGSLSSVFDIVTFVVLLVGFAADAITFRSAWFLESVATELAVLFVLRTRRPFFRSRPSSLLLWTSVVIGAITVVIPFSPVGPVLGLAPLSLPLLVSLLLVTVIYVAANELLKGRFYRATPARPAVRPSMAASPSPASGPDAA